MTATPIGPQFPLATLVPAIGVQPPIQPSAQGWQDELRRAQLELAPWTGPPAKARLLDPPRSASPVIGSLARATPQAAQAALGAPVPQSREARHDESPPRASQLDELAAALDQFGPLELHVTSQLPVTASRATVLDIAAPAERGAQPSRHHTMHRALPMQLAISATDPAPATLGSMPLELPSPLAVTGDLPSPPPSSAPDAPQVDADTQAPMRVHVDWRSEGVSVWLGMHQDQAAQVRSVATQLQRWTAAHGLKLLALSCNGQPVEVDPFEANSSPSPRPFLHPRTHPSKDRS